MKELDEQQMLTIKCDTLQETRFIDNDLDGENYRILNSNMNFSHEEHGILT